MPFIRFLHGREREHGTTEGMKLGSLRNGLARLAFAMIEKRTATTVDVTWVQTHVDIDDELDALVRVGRKASIAVYEIELRERMIRVEEELRHQRDLIKTILEQMDKRFEALTRRIDRFMFWSFAITVSVGGLVVAALKLLLP